MDAVIEGGTRPVGKVRISGAKNSATRLLAAALLADAPVELTNFPTHLVDVAHKLRFCRHLGATAAVDHLAETIRIDAARIVAAPPDAGSFDVPIRTTYLLAAAQVMRSGIARIPYPGGCRIGSGAGGSRGYDLHLMVWRALGATVSENRDHIAVLAPEGFTGATINFPISTVGGTENALLCAAVATGQTQIFNAYITPEIEDLIALLRRMGAEIAVFGTSHIIVDGKGGPLAGARMAVMSDRIEALTWLIYAILARGELTITGIPFGAMTVPLIHIAQAGIDLFRNGTSVHVTPDCLTSGSVQPFELACGAHPGVISDMQPSFVLLGLAGAGTSRVHDYRYPDRIAFVSELQKLVAGEHLVARPGTVTIRGAARFKSGEARATDLRGAMAVVIAALCAEGTSVIHDADLALRGYNDLAGKLGRLGVGIALHETQPERVEA